MLVQLGERAVFDRSRPLAHEIRIFKFAPRLPISRAERVAQPSENLLQLVVRDRFFRRRRA